MHTSAATMLANKRNGARCQVPMFVSGSRGHDAEVEREAGVHGRAGGFYLQGNEARGGGTSLQPGLHLCQSLQ